jgi:hypothetical protein
VCLARRGHRSVIVALSSLADAPPNALPSSAMLDSAQVVLAQAPQGCPALAFSSEPPARPAPRFYTDVAAAGCQLQRHVRQRHREVRWYDNCFAPMPRRTMNSNHATVWLPVFVLAVLLGSCGSSPLDATSKADASDVRTTTSGSETCAMPIEDMDDSCNTDSDCVAVPGGNPCAPDCDAACRTSVVNSRVADRYVADFTSRASVNWQDLVCMCDCLESPYCCHGKCRNQCPGCDGSP